MPSAPLHRRAAAFTLIELLVAISVLSLMILLANRVFLDARRLVSRGMETSQIIASERAISDPLLKDARAMHVAESGQGNNTPGFLLIVQDLIVPSAAGPTPSGIRFPPPEGDVGGVEDWSRDQDGDGNLDINDAVRSDQLVFFRDAKNLDSLTPGADGTSDSLASVKTARVWYGHTSPRVTGSSLDPGRPGNDIANDLVLGRQALLLVEQTAATSYPDGTAGDVSPQPSPNTDNRFAQDRGTTTVDQELSEGTHDVFSLAVGYEPQAGFTVTTYDDGGGIPSTGPALFRSPGWQDPASLTPPGSHSYFERFLVRNNAGLATAPAANQPVGGFASPSSWPADARLPTADYAAAALEWAFARNNAADGNHRLQTDVSLRDDFSAGIFTRDQIASLHAAFLPHVADFAVDFAADFVDELSIDAATGVTTGSAASPDPDGLPDLEPDRDLSGNIKWYTGTYPNPDENSYPGGVRTAGADGLGDVRLDRPVTWPVPDLPPALRPQDLGTPAVQISAPAGISTFDGSGSGTLSGNPFLYVIPPFSTLLSDFLPPTNWPRVVFIFAHSGDDPETDASTHSSSENVIEGSGKYWPYLLRVRYRLMDGRGKYRSIDPVSGEPVVGRWFEQIIPVPRPTGTF
ncbi:PulJ/GspJ family protein [Phycisphaera mikurensis]|uniref:Prepilin-type N-terminal cleavage/methylation domain-containing protein n=1 Tax=Phycisphaera mikurensis (strain NBRC 102666 / KCTC 22515 / FYK2301M01) TaxID=1142394 RepID=I0IFZ8_PHYMF|nr:prepilin-type N-terminal cleavage/methylation domain-containing protein [Phycisphaera mikurensis]MBB6440428.1 prepilin-type N-terminal cleavage/methylation domain-containing protein [Phycisphaera mikurensis]BAM04186.1 hypothetical protein PSMK_20270 [Phycisphaera mikurensis NBRC 102666]